MKRILLVDDSTIMRKNLRAILTKAGYEVVAEAVNGLEGFHAYEKYKPDLVTMDVTMPVLDGIQAVKKIIASYPDAKIVVISAFDQRTMLFEAMENGAKHYIIKPITAEKLVMVIGQILDAPVPEAAAPVAQQQPVPESVQEPQANAPVSVAIENRNGTFFIDMVKQTSHRHVEALEQAMTGLLFIKPLSVVLRFGDDDRFEASVTSRIADLVGKVRLAGGTVTLDTQNPQVLDGMRTR